MTTEMTAPTGGDVASYIGQLVAQVAELEAQLAAEKAEAEQIFHELCVCSDALARIELLMDGEVIGPMCEGCLLARIAAEVEAAEPAYRWAVDLAIDELLEESFDEDDEDLDDEDDETAEDAPADEERVIH